MVPSHLEAAIYEAWDFANPRASMEGFAARTQTEESESSRQIWRTQMARALGLQRDFEGAREILAEVRVALEQLPHGPGRHHLAARLAIESGRVLNSEGAPAAARAYFELANREATAAAADGLAIDAPAHDRHCRRKIRGFERVSSLERNGPGTSPCLERP